MGADGSRNCCWIICQNFRRCDHFRPKWTWPDGEYWCPGPTRKKILRTVRQSWKGCLKKEVWKGCEREGKGLTSGDWYWLVLIGIDWSWLVLIGLDWYWLVLIRIDWYWFVLIGLGWYWLGLIGIHSSWLVVIDWLIDWLIDWWIDGLISIQSIPIHKTDKKEFAVCDDSPSYTINCHHFYIFSNHPNELLEDQTSQRKIANKRENNLKTFKLNDFSNGKKLWRKTQRSCRWWCNVFFLGGSQRAVLWVEFLTKLNFWIRSCVRRCFSRSWHGI